MSQPKIIFLGSKLVARRCLEILLEMQKEKLLKVVGVITKDERMDTKQDTVRDIAKRNGLRIISNLDTLANLNIEYLISVQFHKILKPKHIETAKILAINLHMAPLPEYRGCNQFSYAIIEKKRYFGTTIHQLEEGIDSGAIIAESRFKIPKDVDVKTLYDLTVKKSISLFKKTMPKIICGNYKLISQKNLLKKRGTAIHYRKEIEKLKNIDFTWPEEKIDRYIRATSMPGFEQPYTYILGKKIHLLKYPQSDDN